MLRKATGLLLVLAVALAGCQNSAQSGPSASAIERNSDSRYRLKGGTPDYHYVLVDLSRAVNMAVSPAPVAPPPAASPASLRDSNGAGTASASGSVLGTGDVVQITLYEAEAGGLFIPADATGRQGNYLALPQQQIGRAGTVTVPFAGTIQATGRTPEQLEKAIRDRLADRAIEPQAVVSLVSTHSAEVSVLGDVAAPARLALDPAGDRLLDAIARAGGLRTGVDDASVVLQRGSQNQKVRLSALVANPALNVYLRTGDIVYVSRDRRTFMAFGASGTNGSYAIDNEHMTLSQAIGKAGGLDDNRADPAEVFLYREVDHNRLAALGIDLSRFPEPRVPTVFRANLRDPGAMFAAGHFEIEDGDILYVSNAAGYDFNKFISILGTVASVGASVRTMTN